MVTDRGKCSTTDDTDTDGHDTQPQNPPNMSDQRRSSSSDFVFRVFVATLSDAVFPPGCVDEILGEGPPAFREFHYNRHLFTDAGGPEGPPYTHGGWRA
jgi:hypothetical protein